MKRLLLILLTISIFPSLSFGQMVVRGTIRISKDGVLRTGGPVLLRDSLNSTYQEGVIKNAGTLSLKAPANKDTSLVFYSGAHTDGMLIPLKDGKILLENDYQSNQVKMRKDFKQLKNKWISISFPFDVKVADIVAANPQLDYNENFSIAKYDSQRRANQGILGNVDQSWKNVEQTAILSKGTGYRIIVTSDYQKDMVDFPASATTGNLVNLLTHEDKETPPGHVQLFTGAASSNHHGWNYIGGLNPCAFFLSAHDHGNNIHNTHITWNSLIWNGMIHYLDTNNLWEDISTKTDSAVLSPFVGFFVKIQEDGSFTFKSSGLFDSRTLHPGFRSASLPQQQVLRLNLARESDNDRLYIYLDDQYSEELSWSKDGEKLLSANDPRTRVWSIKETFPLVVNAFPHTDQREVPIGFSLPAAGQYTFRIEDYNDALLSALLVDKVKGESKELLSDSYTFTVNEKVIANDRFLLVLKEKSAATGLPSVDQTGIYAYTAHSYLTVKNLTAGDRIQVIDVAGRLIASGIAAGDTYSTALAGKGIYIVNVMGNRNTVIKVINN